MLEELGISCAEVRRELSNYIENDLALELREPIEAHMARCEGCRAVFDGINNVVCLVSAEELIELPPQLSKKLYERVRKRIVN
jgi:predicted anti-sigma-YlaC factor YlaD